MVFSASVVVFGGWCRRIIWNQHLMVCFFFSPWELELTVQHQFQGQSGTESVVHLDGVSASSKLSFENHGFGAG